jgi:protoheme IX farnesyltransferase
MFLELTKFRISSVSTLSAGTGFLAFRGGTLGGLGAVMAGTLLMAMASSALNELQERDLDALMDRTRLRPIPRGDLGVPLAVALGTLLALSGFLLLWAACGPPTALLGLSALAWYNGLYTPLKRVSAFAVVPGSVIGALPPAMGWVAAGGSLRDPAALALCLFFFVWQVPHFWLLAVLHRTSYEQAGVVNRTYSTPKPFGTKGFPVLCWSGTFGNTL